MKAELHAPTRGKEVVGVEVEGKDDAKRRLPGQAQSAHNVNLHSGQRAADSQVSTLLNHKTWACMV